MELIIIVLGFILDRVTKVMAFDALGGGYEKQIIKGLFSLEYYENTGAAFSMLLTKTMLLAFVSLIAVILMTVVLLKYRKKNRIFDLSLSFLIAGALGNMYDRFFQGYVIDFFKLHYYNKYTFPIFNVADVLVCIGAGFLILYVIKEEIDERRKSSSKWTIQ